MAEYGFFLKYGDMITINYEEAIKYYKMAIEKGNPNAMNNYAYMLNFMNRFILNINRVNEIN